MDPLIGQVLDDEFQIEAFLGEGGCGRVYRGIQLALDRPVAIKVLSPFDDAVGASSNLEEVNRARDAAIESFRIEAGVTSKINDPNIVEVYDFGETDGGLLYLVLELLEGHSLESLIREQAPLSSVRAANIAHQVASALVAAHHRGVVHRDLKPSNIWILETAAGREQVKLLDFGIAAFRNPNADSHKLTVPEGSETDRNSLVGTMRYMAPEQWDPDGEITPQTDLYALGCVVYELLTGTLPYFEADSIPELYTAHCHDPPLKLDTQAHRVGLKPFSTVVATALTPDQLQAYNELLNVLMDVRAERRGTAKDAALTFSSIQANQGRGARGREHAHADESASSSKPAHGQWKLVATVAFLVALLAAYLWIVQTGTGTPDPPERLEVITSSANTSLPITITSTPSGAEVFYGKDRVGVTPVDLPAPLSVGGHPVSARLAGYRDREVFCRVTEEDLSRGSATCHVSLTAKSGKPLAVAPQAPGSASKTRGLAEDVDEVEVGKVFDDLYATSRAVVIGINTFTGWPTLKGAERDAKAVAKLLRETGFEDVVEIYGDEATHRRITDELMTNLPKRVKKDDRLIFYFAGHGQTLNLGGDDKGFFIPSDRRKAEQGVSMEVVQAMLGNLKARHVMFIADACYSGLGLDRLRSGSFENTAHYRPQAQKRARWALSAGDDNQKVKDNYRDGHGLFTYFLLRGLRGDADLNPKDGVITVTELISYVEGRVSKASGGTQHPQFAHDAADDGWLLFEPPSSGP